MIIKPSVKKFLSFMALLATGMMLTSACADCRKPAVAGKFYPASPGDLAAMITKMTQKAKKDAVPPPAGKQLRALIMPHAGYVYAGFTAAHGAMAIKGNGFGRVIVMGPDHYVGFAGAAISKADCYQTPLGKIKTDKAAVSVLKKTGMFIYAPDASDSKEHSVEVILPWLQTRIKRFSLVPVVVGAMQPEALARAIDPIIDDGTLVVASSDLSHYLPYEAAKQRDRETLDIILKRRAGILSRSSNRACGSIPIDTLLILALEHNWEPVLLNYSNSGDTAGPRDRVVGYAAIAFYGGYSMSKKLTQKQGQALVTLARKTIFERLGMASEASGENPGEIDDDTALRAKAGTFVTLTINGELRGCIGSLAPNESIIDGVRRNAVNAAFHDPRFPPLTQQEARIMEVEVSVLTDPQPLEYKDAKDLIAKLRPGVDGVIIKKGLARATFLPQVWEQLPKAEEFLSHLCVKAGLPERAWENGNLEVYTYQVQYFKDSR